MSPRVLFACSIVLWTNSSLFCQQRTSFDPDAILIGDRPQAHVLLVGTFHFGYPGLDAHKTAETDQVDVLSA